MSSSARGTGYTGHINTGISDIACGCQGEGSNGQPMRCLTDLLERKDMIILVAPILFLAHDMKETLHSA